jgi:hypothetical protein
MIGFCCTCNPAIFYQPNETRRTMIAVRFKVVVVTVSPALPENQPLIKSRLAAQWA